MHAVKNNSLEMVQEILQHSGVDVNRKDRNGYDAITHSTGVGLFDSATPIGTFDNDKILDILLKNGANPSTEALNHALNTGAVKIAGKLEKLVGKTAFKYKPSEVPQSLGKIDHCQVIAFQFL